MKKILALSLVVFFSVGAVQAGLKNFKESQYNKINSKCKDGSCDTAAQIKVKEADAAAKPSNNLGANEKDALIAKCAAIKAKAAVKGFLYRSELSKTDVALIDDCGIKVKEEVVKPDPCAELKEKADKNGGYLDAAGLSKTDLGLADNCGIKVREEQSTASPVTQADLCADLKKKRGKFGRPTAKDLELAKKCAGSSSEKPREGSAGTGHVIMGAGSAKDCVAKKKEADAALAEAEEQQKIVLESSIEAAVLDQINTVGVRQIRSECLQVAKERCTTVAMTGDTVCVKEIAADCEQVANDEAGVGSASTEKKSKEAAVARHKSIIEKLRRQHAEATKGCSSSAERRIDKEIKVDPNVVKREAHKRIIDALRKAKEKSGHGRHGRGTSATTGSATTSQDCKAKQKEAETIVQEAKSLESEINQGLLEVEVLENVRVYGRNLLRGGCANLATANCREVAEGTPAVCLQSAAQECEQEANQEVAAAESEKQSQETEVKQKKARFDWIASRHDQLSKGCPSLEKGKGLHRGVKFDRKAAQDKADKRIGTLRERLKKKVKTHGVHDKSIQAGRRASENGIANRLENASDAVNGRFQNGGYGGHSSSSSSSSSSNSTSAATAAAAATSTTVATSTAANSGGTAQQNTNIATARKIGREESRTEVSDVSCQVAGTLVTVATLGQADVVNGKRVIECPKDGIRWDGKSCYLGNSPRAGAYVQQQQLLYPAQNGQCLNNDPFNGAACIWAIVDSVWGQPSVWHDMFYVKGKSHCRGLR